MRRRVRIHPQVNSAIRVGMVTVVRIWGAVASKVQRQGPMRSEVLLVRSGGLAKWLYWLTSTSP